MSETHQTDFRDADRPIFRSRWLPAMMISLTMIVFALVIWAVTIHLRTEIREEVIAREGMVIHSVATMLEREQAAELKRSLLDEQSTQLDIMLKTSRLKGVIGTRLFDANGKYQSSFPANVVEGTIADLELAQLRQARVIGDYRADAPLSRIFMEGTAPASQANLRGPLLDILVPLHFNERSNLLGIAEFLVDGREVADEMSRIDRSLTNQALSVFVLGGLLVTIALRWAFRRLQRAHELLGDRTRNLLEASQALSFATKTSAVGVVTTHLLHELRSQLFGVRSLMEGQANENMNTEWKTGVDSTKRMQNLVNQLIEVIRHELGTNHQYEVSFKDLAELVSAEVAPLAVAAEVKFVTEIKSPGVVSTHVANLLVIILTHLLQNAIQATPRRKTVRFLLGSTPDSVYFEVLDEGPGIPPERLGVLFKPVRSTKEGGSGIGLALCKQLAAHLGAEIGLERTGPNGCLFVVSMPTKLIVSKTVLAA